MLENSARYKDIFEKVFEEPFWFHLSLEFSVDQKVNICKVYTSVVVIHLYPYLLRKMLL